MTKPTIVFALALCFSESCASLAQSQTHPQQGKADAEQGSAKQGEPIIPTQGNPDTSTQQEQPGDAWAKLRDRALDPVTWFTGMLVWVGIRQWRAMHRQADLMRDALTETRNAANVAKESADTSRLMLQIQSANVHIEHVALDPDDGNIRDETIVKTRFKNYGQTDAANLRIQWWLGQLDQTPPEGLPTNPPIVLASQAFITVSSRGRVWDTVTADDWDEVIAGNLRWGFKGSIEFDDVFGRHHRGEFVARLNPRTALFVVERQTHAVVSDPNSPQNH